MTPATDTLSEVTRDLAPASLAQVMAVAELQTRVDRKYLVPTTALRELLTRLAGRMDVLEIDGLRSFAYESVYFDTPGLLTFRQHAQGRRNRFKVRTRTYLDSATTMLEVKTEGARAGTIKDRYPYDVADRHGLTERARRVVDEHLPGLRVADRLELSLVTGYQRATLVDAAKGTRMTCDVGLVFADDRRRSEGPESLVLVESKSPGAVTPVDTILWRLGHRPLSLSKYCLGLALVQPHLPANRWNRTLRRDFGWVPERAAPTLAAAG